MREHQNSGFRMGAVNYDRFDEADFKAGDPRQAFIRDSQALAKGKSMEEVRQAHIDALPAQLSPRERFIQDTQRLAEGEDFQSIRHNRPQGGSKPRRDFRTDAQRTDIGGRLIISQVRDDEEKDDPRADLLKKLAALHSGR